MTYLPYNDPSYDRRKIDGDLIGCLNYNSQEGFDLPDIAEVLAVVEGEHDGASWHWILKLNNGTFAYLVGGCDYTGWD